MKPVSLKEGQAVPLTIFGPQKSLMHEVYCTLARGSDDSRALELVRKYADQIVLWSSNCQYFNHTSGKSVEKKALSPTEIGDQIIYCEIDQLLWNDYCFKQAASEFTSSPESANLAASFANYTYGLDNPLLMYFSLERKDEHQRKVGINLSYLHPDDASTIREEIKALNLPVEITFQMPDSSTEVQNNSCAEPFNTYAPNVFRTLCQLEGIPITNEPSAADSKILRDFWEENIGNGILYHGTSEAFRDSIMTHGLDPSYKPYDVGEIEQLNSIYERVNRDKIIFFTPDHYSRVALTHSEASAREYAGRMPEKIAVILARAGELLSQKFNQLTEEERNFLQTLVSKYEDYQNPKPLIVKVKMLPCLLSAATQSDVEHLDSPSYVNPMSCFLNPDTFARFVKKVMDERPGHFEDVKSAAELIFKILCRDRLEDLRIPVVRKENILEMTN